MCQIYVGAGISRIFFRNKIAGTWYNWCEMWTNNIISITTNSNGTAIRYPDGTMICYHSYRVTSSNSNFSTAYGSIYHNGATTWTFPVEFLDTPKIIATAYLRGGIGGFNLTTVPNKTAIAGYEYSFTSYNFGAGNAGVDFMAIGKWK